MCEPYWIVDDLCGGGIPMTRLSAPVVCNPSISSCPDGQFIHFYLLCSFLFFSDQIYPYCCSGYVCTVYERTGTAYCCQNPTRLQEQDENYCPDDQVTYLEVRCILKPQKVSLCIKANRMTIGTINTLPTRDILLKQKSLTSENRQLCPIRDQYCRVTKHSPFSISGKKGSTNRLGLRQQRNCINNVLHLQSVSTVSLFVPHWEKAKSSEFS